MFGSLRIGSVFGIHVRLHWLFIVLVVWVVSTGQVLGSPLISAAYVAVLFGVVFLHELGHSVVAQRFGIRVIDITLWPLGGMARMSEIPENTRIEGLVAIAGPAVNFALAAFALPLADLHVLRGFVVGEVVAPSTLFAGLAAAFVAMNLYLGLFNLLPAFPMDGGRILRAFLGWKNDWLKATERAVSVGRWIAGAMVLAGLFATFKGAGMLPLVGVFVWFAGTRELWSVRMRRHQEGLERAMGFAPPVVPGVVEVVGSRAAADGAARAEDTGARRPEVEWRPASGRLSDADLERLERYRGRLRGS